MPEIRKDYATKTWVIFSAARSRRPGAFRASKSATPKETCPFCIGHEAMTPPEVLAYRRDGVRDGPGWRIRCVPNMFPALEPRGDVRKRGSGLFVSFDGVGAHEIIVESPDHDGHIATMDSSQIGEMIRAYRDRYLALSADPRVQYILIFKNHGERAGASISHPHSQLIATPIVPLQIAEEMEGVQAYAKQNPGACLYCDVITREREEARRIVAENAHFVAFAPYAARFPFETWILPKEHGGAFESFPDGHRAPLADLLKDILARMVRVLDDPSFNYYIHTAPRGEADGRYHWHLEITPNLTEIAGFERGSGFYINPVIPEDAASILKGEVRWTDRGP